MFTTFISYAETHEFFQFELILLLVSLFISVLLSGALPYFVASAICLLATTASLVFELFAHVSGPHTYVEATTTLTFAVILSGTFVHALVQRLCNVQLRWHTITSLGLWSYLTLRAVWILEDTARPIHLHIDEQSLEAAGFAALHLMASVLMPNDQPKPPKEYRTIETAEKTLDIV